MGSSLSLAAGKKKTKEMILPEISEELLVEILMRLPAKSLMRFKCVSKIWLSLISSRYLTNLFLKSSSSHRRLFAYKVDDEEQIKYTLLTSSSHDNSDTYVSVIDQDLTMPGMGGDFVSAVRGLVCFASEDRVRICNLSTRQVVELPVMRSIGKRHYFGHDPVHDEYKVLSVVWEVTKEKRMRSEHQVLVLGAGASWRKIQCHIPHCPHPPGVTINGVLYYLAWTGPISSIQVLMSFDLSSQVFNLIELPNVRLAMNLSWTNLMNYKGKIAVFKYLGISRGGAVDVWVLEDADKSQWSNKKTFVLPISQMNVVPGDEVRMGGTSCSGKVWLAKVVRTRNLPVHFFIYDLERNEIAQRIEIRPLRDRIGMIFGSFKTNWWISTFWDDIESIMYLEI